MVPILVVLLVTYIFCLPKPIFEVPYCTVVTDRNNDLLGVRIADDGQWRFPLETNLSEKYKTCLLTFEDRAFYYHWGINPVALCRATFQNIKAKRVVSGASTITMQIARMMRKKERTVYEKMIEMVLATRIEFRYSKKELLSLYATHAPFGGNTVGIEAASWRYFNHSSCDLSWAEAALLAVLPNAPAMIHLEKNRPLLLQKRNRLLKKLLEKNIITINDYESAVSESLPDRSYVFPNHAPQLVDHYYKNSKGKRIKTTIDKMTQMQTEDVIEQWNNQFVKKDIRNMAAIIIDVNNNEIIAYCGNIMERQQEHGNQVDIIKAPRSTGSILKPFLYCAAIQDGLILPGTLLADIPVNINGFKPENFDHSYQGAVPATEAMARSLNVPAVILLKKYSVPKFYNFLKQAGMTTLRKPSSHYGLSLILGGAEGTLYEISTLYCNMARSLLALPYSSLRLCYNDTEKQSQKQNPFNAGAVWHIFNALTSLNRPEEITWEFIPSMQKIAWKTGTSYGYRDAWAVGVTPRYVVGVWTGNATGEGKAGLVGARTAGPVMFDIFNFLPSSQWFSMPEYDLTPMEICHQSGHLKGYYCTDIDTISLPFASERTPSCPYHQPVVEGKEEIGTIIQTTAFILPPAWAQYYKQYNPDFQQLKDYSGTINAFLPMQFIYPSNPYSKITIPKQLDGKRGIITLELAHSAASATVFWHIDQNYFTSTKDIHKISIYVTSGKHTITVVDDEGNSLSTTIMVE